MYFFTNDFIQRKAYGLRHLFELHGSRGLCDMHGPGCSTHAARLHQGQKQTQLTKGDIHRLYSIDKYLKIDFTNKLLFFKMP